ncbi:MAG: hypothetical protein HRT99_04085, partial [Mycoplasmatales bacterium]|nr:hypothetical protein [Mycoplasmatales bacterium]
YKENNNDLTIITNWLVLNIKEILNYGTNKMIFDMPELSKNNINFIQTFNKEKQSYSINDYIKLVKCSYETGRKSLEKLVKLDLYRKNKLGKKFVYKPTKKLKNILKGGEYGN